MYINSRNKIVKTENFGGMDRKREKRKVKKGRAKGKEKGFEKEGRDQVEKEGEKIGCECRRRCFRKGEGDHPLVSVSGELVVGMLVVVYVSLVRARAT